MEHESNALFSTDLDEQLLEFRRKTVRNFRVFDGETSNDLKSSDIRSLIIRKFENEKRLGTWMFIFIEGSIYLTITTLINIFLSGNYILQPRFLITSTFSTQNSSLKATTQLA
jgi:hypothetical protein